MSNDIPPRTNNSADHAIPPGIAAQAPQPAPASPASGIDSAEWLRVTLSSIGDGVITTDHDGLVTFLNPVAQALTGWTPEQAVGVALERVFHIVNEETRAKVENPALRALAEGVIVGLANHSLLIAKDGTERPIDDSAAPIRAANGETAGAVLVFRDVTEHKKQQRLVTDAFDYATNILETQREPFLVLDKDLLVVSANRSFYRTFRVEKEATEGRFVYDLGDGQWNIPKLRDLLGEVLTRNRSFEGFEVEHDFPGGVGRKTMVLNVRRIERPGNHSELILLAIEDATERKRTEALLASQQQSLELAISGVSLKEVLEFLARSAQQQCGDQSRAALFVIDPDGARLRSVAAAGMAEAYTLATDGFVIGPRQPSCGTAAFTGKTVIVADVTKDPLWEPYLALAKEHEIRACWSEPMQTFGGKVLGTMAIYHKTPREPRPGDLEAVRLLSRTAAIVIQRHRESEHRAQAERAQRDSEVRYRRLFETAKDGILILDAHSGEITDANSFMCGLTGMKAAEIRGKQLYDIGMYKDVEENKQAFLELQRTGYLRHDHLPVKNRSGEKVAVEFIANVYHEGDRLVAQCNVRDISERSRLEKLIAQQNEALAAQSRSKDEFLAMLSHELRNPLAPIRSAVHLLRLQEGGGNPIQQQAREIIERQVANLTKMVSDLSEVSRVVSGRIRLELQATDLKHVLRHALQAVAPLFEQRKHSVSASLCAESVWAQADPSRIEEVLVNLLNNAAKYTPDGGRIGVSCEHHREGDKQFALLRVGDNGVGIDQELLPRIFDLFTQADRSLARSAGGLGIGLALAHRLVTLHGGSIWATSAGPGMGSEFTVRLPLVPSPVALPETDGLSPTGRSPLPGVVEAHGEPGSQVRVLVVDDNVDLVTMLCGTLRHKGYSVQSAHTGPDGLKIARQWQPDIVLLDIGLPGLDGYEIARRLRSDPAPRDPRKQDELEMPGAPLRMKLIAITGYGQDADIELAREAGFDGHMVKPCDFDELEKMMTAPR